MNIKDILAADEALKVARRLPAARRRAVVARDRADRRATPENLAAANELEAGLLRMEQVAGLVTA